MDRGGWVLWDVARYNQPQETGAEITRASLPDVRYHDRLVWRKCGGERTPHRGIHSRVNETLILLVNMYKSLFHAGDFA